MPKAKQHDWQQYRELLNQAYHELRRIRDEAGLDICPTLLQQIEAALEDDDD